LGAPAEDASAAVRVAPTEAHAAATEIVEEAEASLVLLRGIVGALDVERRDEDDAS
jgi:hypothetical protein